MRSVILDRLRGKDSLSLAGQQPFGTGIYGERYEPETRRDFVEAYRDRGWVQRAINYTANAADSVPFRLWSGPMNNADGSREIEGDHALRALLDRPCPRDTGQTFASTCVKWGQMVGEWYWEIVPSRRGEIAEAYPMRSHLVNIVPDQERPGYVREFTYDPHETGQVIELPAAEPATGRLPENQVVYGRFANPFDDYYGMAPLRGAKDDVISEYYAVRYDQRFFRNSARPDVIIGFKGSVDRDQRKLNKEAWDKFKGVDNAHRAAVLSGDPNVTELGKTPREVQYLEGRKLAREGECGALGVPPILIGILDRATYSNYQEAEPIFWRATMIPLLDYLASWINWTIVPYFKGVDWVDFDTSGVQALQPNEQERIDRLSRGVTGGIFKPNEAREEVDLEPVDGGDTLFVPINVLPIDQAASSGPEYPAPAPTPDPNEPVPVPPGEPSPDPGHEAATWEELLAKVEAGQVKVEALTRAQAEGLAATVDAALAGETVVPLWAAALQKASPQIGQARATRYLHMRAGALRAGQRMGASRVRSAMSAQEKEILALLLPKAKEERKASELVGMLEARDWGKDAVRLTSAIASTHLSVAKAAGAHTDALLGTEVAFGGDNPALGRVLQHLANRPKGINSVSGRVKEEVLDEVRNGLALGLTHQQIAQGGRFDVGPPGDRAAEQVDFKGIRGVYSEYKGWQAERVARSEGSVAYNVAAAASFREVGVQEVDIIDGDDDDPCAEANGSVWPLDEYDANPTEHPNCTRVGIPRVEGVDLGTDAGGEG